MKTKLNNKRKLEYEDVAESSSSLVQDKRVDHQQLFPSEHYGIDLRKSVHKWFSSNLIL